MGWVVTAHAGFDPVKFSLGRHGYDPDAPEMAALFVAHGPSFRRGVVLPPFDNVDVYPLLAKVAGIRPEPNDGRLADVAAALRP
jgi:predicted AlkP superfamily pyrophosphatase or phosphodiesterase